MEKERIQKAVIYTALMLAVIVFSYSLFQANLSSVAVNSQAVSNTELSNKKIGWGIKREGNHNQPDLGKVNKELINKYEGICMGNIDKKNIYLTFDEGYEAGYTEKILDTLKENNVKATFFITAHYLNTQEELVKRMISEGHIVGNHIPVTYMYQKIV